MYVVICVVDANSRERFAICNLRYRGTHEAEFNTTEPIHHITSLAIN